MPVDLFIKGDISRTGFSFPGRCATCGTSTAFRSVHARRFTNEPSKASVLGTCHDCEHPSMAIVEEYGEGHWVLTHFFSTIDVTATPEELPAEVQNIYRKVALLVNTAQPELTILLCESLLAAIAKDKKIRARKFSRALQTMEDKGIIPPTLREAAEEISKLDKRIIDPDTAVITMRDALAIWELVNLIINYIYILPTLSDLDSDK